MTQLSHHFALAELIPRGMKLADVPPAVEASLTMLAAELLEPLRVGMGLPVIIHSGWRPSARNAAVGGVAASDHLVGRAADFHVAASATAPWEDNTEAAFHWLRLNRAGRFGQLILEDHRAHLGVPGKLWVHAAIRSPKHPGTADDPNRILTSPAPHIYRQWKELA